MKRPCGAWCGARRFRTTRAESARAACAARGQAAPPAGAAAPLYRKGDLVGALNVTMPMGNESTDDAVARVLPVLQETARAMRNLI